MNSESGHGLEIDNTKFNDKAHYNTFAQKTAVMQTAVAQTCL